MTSSASPRRHIHVNAFHMNCVGHIHHGLWAHPQDRSTEYHTLKYWTDIAQTLERGLFDGLFIADASVFASLITVNINAAVMMVAEKAAECILADQLP